MLEARTPPFSILYCIDAVQQGALADQPNRSDFPGSDAIEWFVQFRAPVACRLAAKLHRWADGYQCGWQDIRVRYANATLL